MSISLDAVPEEDSADFTAAEASGAIPTSCLSAVVDVLREQKCGCGGHAMPKRYALRRLAGHLYWRVTLGCPLAHDRQVIIQTDWLRGES